MVFNAFPSISSVYTSRYFFYNRSWYVSSNISGTLQHHSNAMRNTAHDISISSYHHEMIVDILLHCKTWHFLKLALNCVIKRQWLLWKELPEMRCVRNCRWSVSNKFFADLKCTFDEMRILLIISMIVRKMSTFLYGAVKLICDSCEIGRKYSRKNIPVDMLIAIIPFNCANVYELADWFASLGTPSSPRAIGPIEMPL